MEIRKIAGITHYDPHKTTLVNGENIRSSLYIPGMFWVNLLANNTMAYIEREVGVSLRIADCTHLSFLRACHVVESKSNRVSS